MAIWSGGAIPLIAHLCSISSWEQSTQIPMSESVPLTRSCIPSCMTRRRWMQMDSSGGNPKWFTSRNGVLAPSRIAIPYWAPGPLATIHHHQLKGAQELLVQYDFAGKGSAGRAAQDGLQALQHFKQPRHDSQPRHASLKEAWLGQKPFQGKPCKYGKQGEWRGKWWILGGRQGAHYYSLIVFIYS